MNETVYTGMVMCLVHKLSQVSKPSCLCYLTVTLPPSLFPSLTPSFTPQNCPAQLRGEMRSDSSASSCHKPTATPSTSCSSSYHEWHFTQMASYSLMGQRYEYWWAGFCTQLSTYVHLRVHTLYIHVHVCRSCTVV